MPTYPFSSPGIWLSQPFGDFLVTSIPARVLLDNAYSDRLTAIKQPDGTYKLDGSQRVLAEPRLKEIGLFIDSAGACFPNTIILAANYRESDGLNEDVEPDKWFFTHDRVNNTCVLTIPTEGKRAAIIDGQHRLFGFDFVSKPDRLDMPLVCAIYFELPKSYQARLFATINSTQRPVNKSQTYELFGYNIEAESADKWTPEKLSVFMARKLNADEESPFYNHIIVPADNDFSPTLSSARRAGDWAVSLATIVEGIVRLISNNPKTDSFKMAGELRYTGHSRSVLDRGSIERTPLRELYLEGNDSLIYTAINNYFKAVKSTLWHEVVAESYIRKTVGIQALFDISRRLIHKGVAEHDLRVETFTDQLSPTARLDFSDNFFHASGASRIAIRKMLEFVLRWKTLTEEEPNYHEYRRLLDMCSVS